MDNGIHSIAGLPRSGSTLLAALLRQNLRFHAGMTSPVGSFFAAMQRAMSHDNEAAVFIDERHRLLLVRFETLTADPHGTLAGIYDFLGESDFRDDPGHVETNYDEVMFDARLGTPGLHSLGSIVRTPAPRPSRPTCSPATTMSSGTMPRVCRTA